MQQQRPLKSQSIKQRHSITANKNYHDQFSMIPFAIKTPEVPIMRKTAFTDRNQKMSNLTTRVCITAWIFSDQVDPEISFPRH